MARDIRLNVSYIYKIHLFIISTDKLSKAVKTLELPEYTYNGQENVAIFIIIGQENVIMVIT